MKNHARVSANFSLFLFAFDISHIVSQQKQLINHSSPIEIVFIDSKLFELLMTSTYCSLILNKLLMMCIHY